MASSSPPVGVKEILSVRSACLICVCFVVVWVHRGNSLSSFLKSMVISTDSLSGGAKLIDYVYERHDGVGQVHLREGNLASESAGDC